MAKEFTLKRVRRVLLRSPPQLVLLVIPLRAGHPIWQFTSRLVPNGRRQLSITPWATASLAGNPSGSATQPPVAGPPRVSQVNSLPRGSSGSANFTTSCRWFPRSTASLAGRAAALIIPRQRRLATSGGVHSWPARPPVAGTLSHLPRRSSGSANPAPRWLPLQRSSHFTGAHG